MKQRRWLLEKLRRFYWSTLAELAIKAGIHDRLSRTYWWLKLNSIETVRITISGIDSVFLIDTKSEYQRFAESGLMGERPVLKDFLDNIAEGDIVYDIGANVGTYTCFAAALTEDKETVAFEPVKSNRDRLRDNLSLNNRDARIEDLALSDTEDEVALSGDETQGAGNMAIQMNSDKANVHTASSTIDILTADGNLPSPDIIKLDVEGHEMRVLEGAEQILETGLCRIIYCEVHPQRMNDYGDKTDDLISFLKEKGYETTILKKSKQRFFLKAMR